jgi:hypothetical protein
LISTCCIADGIRDYNLILQSKDNCARDGSAAVGGGDNAGNAAARVESKIERIRFASAGELGLQSNDVIDALCLEENGDGFFGEGDNILFSLAPGSPSLLSLNARPGSLLSTQPLQVIANPASLGLAATDDVDAMACGLLVIKQINGVKSFLPMLGKNLPSQ